ncbi:MAG: protein kinase [Planctomycetota bacterium]
MTEPATLTEPKTASAATLPTISGYALAREKGVGPKAIVYKARRVFENDLVAIKLFHKGVCDRAMRLALEKGVEKTEDLKHSGLIRALGFGVDEGRPFLVLEYASGESLASFMSRGQQFPASKAVAIIAYCVKTLKFAAEKGHCHGRLHPGRIILGTNNIRISGVGMGERPEHAAWSAKYAHPYEPLIYTAPEALPSKPFPETKTDAVDIYSLGAILFHVLTRTLPFRGTDEGAISAERAHLKHPIDWPAGARVAYPKELANLIDAMLDPDPTKRPGYSKLLNTLGTIQAEMQVAGAEAWQPPAVEAGKANAAVMSANSAPTVIGAPRQFSSPGVGGAVASTIPSSTPDIATVPVLSSKKAGESTRNYLKRHTIYHAKRSALDVIFSTLLFCMTALVFCCTVYVTMQPYLPERYRLVARFIQQPDVIAAAQKAPAPIQGANKLTDASYSATQKVVQESAKQEDIALAQRQLDKVHEMLLNSDILPSAGLAKLLRGISDRAGRTSPTGIRALILASEIDSKINPGKMIEPVPQIPVTPPAPPVAKNETPAPVKPDTTAVTKVPAVVQPEPVKAPASVAKAVEAPKPAAPASVPGVANALKLARQQLKYFGYAKAKESLEQFLVKANSEQKRVAADYRTLISYEEGLYERCHAKLLDHIKKDPKHESLLQVFPRENDPIGDDIIDFDEKGLSILVKGGNNKGVKLTPWDKFPAKQVLNLLIPLSTKNSLEDQIGMAVFAYNRGLSVESEDALGKAEALPNGKEKAGAVADTFVKITRAFEAAE